MQHEDKQTIRSIGSIATYYAVSKFLRPVGIHPAVKVALIAVSMLSVSAALDKLIVLDDKGEFYTWLSDRKVQRHKASQAKQKTSSGSWHSLADYLNRKDAPSRFNWRNVGTV